MLVSVTTGAVWTGNGFNARLCHHMTRLLPADTMIKVVVTTLPAP